MNADGAAVEYIYVLKLQRDKYFVGKTKDLTSDIEGHLFGRAPTEWTQLFRPLGVEPMEVVAAESPVMIDLLVKMYMFEFGIDSVRGGSYSEVRLEPDQERALQQEFETARNFHRCFCCGSPEHFVPPCPQRNASRASNTPAAIPASFGFGKNPATNPPVANPPAQNLFGAAPQAFGAPAAAPNPGAAPAPGAPTAAQNPSQPPAAPVQIPYCPPPAAVAEPRPSASRPAKPHETMSAFVAAFAALGAGVAVATSSRGEPTSSCRGITKTGTRCQVKMYLDSNGYCSHHREQYYASPIPSTTRTCRGITKDGYRCRCTKQIDAYGFCPHHGDQANVSRICNPVKRGECYRCGRNGHWASDCYARTDVDGDPLY